MVSTRSGHAYAADSDNDDDKTPPVSTRDSDDEVLQVRHHKPNAAILDSDDEVLTRNSPT